MRIIRSGQPVAASGHGTGRGIDRGAIAETAGTDSGGRQDAHDRRRDPGRALVALEASPRAAHAPRSGHSAPFIAQLLANRIGLPQTRERRRTPASDGSAQYSAANALSGARRIGISDSRRI